MSSFWSNLVEKAKEYYKRFKAAKRYVDAINNLPPTYETGQNFQGFSQIIPDPVSDANLEAKLKEAKEAEEEWLKFCQENNVK